MVKAAKKKIKERGFVSYFPKLAKKVGVGARSEVHHELEKMLHFALKTILDAGDVILSDYDQKCETVRPKLIQAAVMTSLHSDLKASAMTAGAEAVVRKFNKEKGSPQETSEDAAVEVAA